MLARIGLPLLSFLLPLIASQGEIIATDFCAGATCQQCPSFASQCATYTDCTYDCRDGKTGVLEHQPFNLAAGEAAIAGFLCQDDGSVNFVKVDNYCPTDPSGKKFKA